MTPIDQLKSVLCDPEGKCCIAGSDEDRAIVDRALEALAQQEPVAWSSFDILTGNVKVLWGGKPTLGPLYTSPLQRKPLTDEEIDAVMPQPTKFGILQPPWNGLDITILRAMARAIEAKLKEKST